MFRTPVSFNLDVNPFEFVDELIIRNISE